MYFFMHPYIYLKQTNKQKTLNVMSFKVFIDSTLAWVRRNCLNVYVVLSQSNDGLNLINYDFYLDI